MKEQMVTYDVADLAIKKGFNLETDSYYGILPKYHNLYSGVEDPSKIRLYTWGKKKLSHIILIENVPTQSLLQKWLREVHNLNVEVTAHAYNKEDKHFSFRVIIKIITKTNISDNNGCLSDIETDFYIFRTYEEALEKGLYEALKMIE
jgi:hypothetical protein